MHTEFVFVPDSIRFDSWVTRRFFGAPAIVDEVSPPEMRGSLRLPDGSHADMSIPLDAEEQAMLKHIRERVAERAIALLRESLPDHVAATP